MTTWQLHWPPEQSSIESLTQVSPAQHCEVAVHAAPTPPHPPPPPPQAPTESPWARCALTAGAPTVMLCALAGLPGGM